MAAITWGWWTGLPGVPLECTVREEGLGATLRTWARSRQWGALVGCRQVTWSGPFSQHPSTDVHLVGTRSPQGCSQQSPEWGKLSDKQPVFFSKLQGNKKEMGMGTPAAQWFSKWVPSGPMGETPAPRHTLLPTEPSGPRPRRSDAAQAENRCPRRRLKSHPAIRVQTGFVWILRRKPEQNGQVSCEKWKSHWICTDMQESACGLSMVMVVSVNFLEVLIL